MKKSQAIRIKAFMVQLISHPNLSSIEKMDKYDEFIDKIMNETENTNQKGILMAKSTLQHHYDKNNGRLPTKSIEDESSPFVGENKALKVLECNEANHTNSLDSHDYQRMSEDEVRDMNIIAKKEG